MREIKFRAWHKADKKMYVVLGFVKHQWFLKGKTYPMPTGAIVIRQYTGLKDKNGKEIYEGDIVYQEFYDSRPINVGGFTGEVKFYEGAWWIDNNKHAEPLWSDINLNEVIGNIYENPELLGEIK